MSELAQKELMCMGGVELLKSTENSGVFIAEDDSKCYLLEVVPLPLIRYSK